MSRRSRASAWLLAAGWFGFWIAVAAILLAYGF